MTTIISLFNHKGGVGKTTTTFNVGWALSELGKKVLIVDGDPQCNLTGNVLSFDEEQDFESFYNGHQFSDLYSCLKPTFEGQQEALKPAEVVPTVQPNLFLLPGHIDFSQNEAQLAIALNMGSHSVKSMQNLPGAIHHLLKITGDANKFDYIIVDMSPNAGAVNQCFLMGSDYFIIPTFPDYFCYQALYSLSRILPGWNKSIEPFRDVDLLHRISKTPPKFLGMISQRYRPRHKKPGASDDYWIKKNEVAVAGKLVPALRQHGLLNEQLTYNIANIPEFNALRAMSLKHNVPVFALRDSQIEKKGIVLDAMKKSRDEFKKTFINIAQTISQLTN